MANREGINPLRPYYIPPSGLSPASNAPPEVTSPSSAQVFGSTARDLIPDLDYADYLDASPSVSDWVRDALNGALVRYTKVLTAQPFDVAKTILQVYVVPDAADEELDREPTPDKAGSSYDSVRDMAMKAFRKLLCLMLQVANLPAFRSPSRPMTKAATSHQRPLQRKHRAHRDLADHDARSLTGAVIFDPNLRRSLSMR